MTRWEFKEACNPCCTGQLGSRPSAGELASVSSHNHKRAIDVSKKRTRIKQKLAWLGRGTEAFRGLNLGLPDYYVCPLCLHGFPPESWAALTREHVPPEAVGGSRLTLTCWRCNNHASGKDGVDTHASIAETMRSFGEGTLGRPVRARLTIDSLTVNVDLENEAKGLQITNLPNRNRPGTSSRIMEILKGYSESGHQGWSFQLSVPAFNCSDHRQRVSWLRAGYLAAFASLGYRFAFRSVLGPVREQIRYPDRPVISWFHFVRGEAPAPPRFLMIVQSPAWANGLMVHMGRHYVMLPLLDGDHAFYSRLESEATAASEFQLTGKMLPWPRGPEHLFDFWR
jgi:hypothetical protein